MTSLKRGCDSCGKGSADVLDVLGQLIDDRPPPIERYFTGKSDGPPKPTKPQLAASFDVMLNEAR